MRKLYKDSILVFLRSKNLSIPYFVLLALILIYIGFCFNNYLQYSDIFSVTIWLVRPLIFLIAFFIYIGYEHTIKIYDNNMVEYFNTYQQGLLKIYGVILLCLLTIVVIPSIIILAFTVFMYYYIDVQYLPFLIHLKKLSVLYFGLSFIIGIMLGTAMAAKLKTKRLAVYSLTVIFILLNTTFTDIPFRIPYSLFNSYLTEKMLYYFKDFFSVVPHELGNSFILDPIYGFPMEPIRWILAVFWIIFPLTLILTECFFQKTKKALIATSCFILLSGIGLFSVRGSTLLRDMRVDSYPYADPHYYMVRPREDYDGYQAGFIIEEYQMDFTISNELHAEVEVKIDNLCLDNYEFTLYHGYILKSIRTQNGEIPFNREGDYVSIGNLNGADKLIFNYYGKSPKYYANRQAITLPGYFAYYPKAGRANIWESDQYGYVINTSPNESNYTVNILSNLEIICNLAGGDNSFHGKSNGVSLFAGMYDEVADNIFAEPMRVDLPKIEYIGEAEEILTDIFNRLDRPDYFIHISDKKFFQVPRNFALNSNTEDTVVMSDHITSTYCNNGQELAEGIMKSITNPKSASWFLWSYFTYLFNRQDETDLIFQGTVDLNLLLKEIDELRFLDEKHQNMNSEKYLKMNEQEREAFEADEKRTFELNNIVSEKAAKYLFYESPRRDENMSIFLDYFMSEIEEDYLELVKKIVREDLKHDYR
ncbi:hypothetical protein [Candidatus Contubernalis alkaliaceticus]|uniref:hypothetical protein n=1 Tax=Candidatus Contubernalis alkaliaceticus TaxID=338645 RepID=UPI001F4C2722|nr:hypothetical protein [Candidatus Contubernalis alkalaceticus]UNC91050.1 hypothetical protein HUE98_02490 [Candidatus Contubernalis alkalaceticus]